MRTGAACLLVVVLAAGCRGAADPPRASPYDDGLRLLREGRLADAEAAAARGYAAAESGDEPAWRSRLLHAEILITANRRAEAERLLADEVPERAASSDLRARREFLLARLQVDNGRLDEALATLERARTMDGSGDAALDILRLDGQVRLRLGQWDAGESRLADAAADAARAGDGYRRAQALNDLGMSRLRRGRYDEALPRFEQIITSADLDGTTIFAQAQNNAGIAYARLGQFERAIEVQRHAVEIHRRGNPRAFIEAVGGLGNTFVLQGRSREAVLYLKEAFDAATHAQLVPEAALWAGNLASAYADLEEWDEARRYNDEARRLHGAGGPGNPVYHTLTDAQIAAGRHQLDEARRLYDEALAAAPAPAVTWTAHAGLARIAIAAGDPARAAQSFELALDTIEKTRSDLLKTDYRLTFLTRLIDFYRDYVDFLIAQGQVTRALEVAESSRGQVLTDRQGGATSVPRATAAALQRVARKGAAVLLSFWIAPENPLVWIVTGDSIRHVRLPQATEIEPLVREYRATIENAMADPLARSTAGDRLYAALIDPVRAWLPPETRAIVAPDGPMHGLNIETLPVFDSATGERHYLIEDLEVQIAPSLAALVDAAPADGRVTPLLLAGAATPREPEFPELPHAGVEMANVARHFPPGDVREFRGGAATPQAILDAGLDRFGAIHFAAHATAQAETPLDSAIVLSGPDDRHKLYAREVAAMKLRADLVTVSACRSAGDRAYSGEGLVGFAWAFLRSGARRVVAGLWDVDDRSTAALMDALYGRLAAGAHPAAAMRVAKLQMVHGGGRQARPYHWGAFQVFTITP